VEGERGRGAGERVDFGGVSEFFLESAGGFRLYEFAETGSGIGKSPRGQLNLKRIQGFEDGLGAVSHGGFSRWFHLSGERNATADGGAGQSLGLNLIYGTGQMETLYPYWV
jgi:hypothetical protein